MYKLLRSPEGFEKVGRSGKRRANSSLAKAKESNPRVRKHTGRLARQMRALIKDISLGGKWGTQSGDPKVPPHEED